MLSFMLRSTMMFMLILVCSPLSFDHVISKVMLSLRLNSCLLLFSSILYYFFDKKL